MFGHHATGSLTADLADEEASDCSERDEHGHDTNPGCDRDPRSSEPIHLGEELKELFLAHPHVVAYVAGHSHNNRVEPFKADGGSGFWEIKSPAISDWPPQHRLIELMENCDGTLSVFGTMLDHDAPVDAPQAGPAAGFSAAELASVGRVLTYNDPQGIAKAPPASRPTATSSCCSTTRARNGPRDPKLRLRVKPRRVRADRRVRLRFRVRERGTAGQGRRRPLQGQAQGGRTRRVSRGCRVRVGEGASRARHEADRLHKAARERSRSPALARVRLAACVATSAPSTTSSLPPPRRRSAPPRSSTCAR